MTQFEEQDCIDCGVRFGVPIGYTKRRQQDKKRFFCPNGHSMSYIESSEDVIRRESDRLKQQIAEKDDRIRALYLKNEEQERKTAAARGQVTRMKNRAKAGLCLCCNRHFTNLERHMNSKHPNETAESTP